MSPWLLAACMESSNPVKSHPDQLTLAVGLATVPASFSDVTVAGGLTNPTLMAIAPDGRIFVSEQAGRVRVIKNGSLLGTPFVTLNVNSSWERGALGIAFDPAFSSNHFVYVYYTSSSGPHNRVSRFTANGDVASGGETVLLDLPTLSSATNHNSGSLHFGEDGKLYISVGENANGANAQSLNTPLGKLLRINADGTIPSDNPFYGSTSGNNRAIWAMGLRNPYTFAFQPGTGRLFINDVGQSTWEEINDGAKGANYGWPTTEGVTSDSRFKSPFYTYNHSSGCAITGGDFYNPTNTRFPSDYVGDYFFGDYCGGWIKRLDVGSKTVSNFASGISSLTDIVVGDDGALYYVERGSGSVRKISYTNSSAPVISQQPASQTVPVGDSATFTVAASGATPFSYGWQRNGIDISGATSPSYTLGNVQVSDNGAKFRCIVSNASGSATSNEATLTVIADMPPAANITSPAAGATFKGGQVIGFAGSGTDPEDGTLPASAFTWEVRLWHNDGNLHSHPIYGPVSGSKSGSITIPTQGETSPNIWYRFYLTVKDSKGLIARDSVDVLPVKVSITLAANPTGLQVTLDGMAQATPFTFTGVVGITRTLGVVSPQSSGGETWTFQSWSDGMAATHDISTPGANATFTATYGSGSAVTLETENLATTANVSTVIESDARFSNGKAIKVFGTAVGNYCEWTLPNVTAGTYNVTFYYKRLNTRAVVQSSIDGSNQGGTVDMYGATEAWQVPANLGSMTFSTTGNRVLRLTVTGKNGASSGYSMHIDKIVLTKQ